MKNVSGAWEEAREIKSPKKSRREALREVENVSVDEGMTGDQSSSDMEELQRILATERV